MKKRFSAAGLLAGNNGFTLIEALISLLVLTLSLTGLAIMQGTAVKGNDFANEQTQATFLAQQMLEQLDSSPLSPHAAVVTPLTAGTTVTETAIDVDGNPGGIFTRTHTVTANTLYSRRISTTVTWNRYDDSGNQVVRTVTLNSITRGDQN